jgi:hypothetical protein
MLFSVCTCSESPLRKRVTDSGFGCSCHAGEWYLNLFRGDSLRITSEDSRSGGSERISLANFDTFGNQTVSTVSNVWQYLIMVRSIAQNFACCNVGSHRPTNSYRNLEHGTKNYAASCMLECRSSPTCLLHFLHPKQCTKNGFTI